MDAIDLLSRKRPTRRPAPEPQAAADGQLSLLTDELAPNQWRCPGCAGTGRRARHRYPDEPADTTVPARCRACHGTGIVDYDPDDHSEIPY